MPITWDEARKLNADLEAKQAYDAMPFHVGDRWDRLHPVQQSRYRDIARQLLKDVDALMQEER